MRETPFIRNGITILSGHDPVRRAQRIADAVSLRDGTLYFCPSPLYGYGLESLLARIKADTPGCAILCVEADPELLELSKNNIAPSFFSENKFRITEICEAAALCGFIRETWGPRAFKRIETVRFTGGWQLFGGLYDSLCEALRREIATDWSNALTLTKMGRLYIRNAFRNLSLIPSFPSLGCLSFGFSPVLVLGAGPSLDAALDAVQKSFSGNLAVDKRPFKIVCADTCLGALKDRNIVPDLVVILESQHWNLADFTGLRGWNVPAAADLSSLPASLRVLAGGGFLYMTPWTDLRIFNRLKESQLLPSVVSPLGSVGLTAVEICRRLGSGKIICAGLDFSFTAEKYHARGTPGHKKYLNKQTRFKRTANRAAFADSAFTAVSKSGSPVRSNPVMRNYRELFEREFSGDGRLYDIEGTGLPLGVKTLTMEEALEILKNTVNMDNENSHAEAQGRRDAERREEKSEENFQESFILKTEKIKEFVRGEKRRLQELREILTGEKEAGQGRLDALICECDYLWGHFADYAGGKAPPLAEDAPEKISFLKRVRAEIDPMIKLLSTWYIE
jgi:uncharacterized Rossmann fold enzyme